ncbi:MAG: lipocalin family protein [Rikenellaceae bacterium]
MFRTILTTIFLLFIYSCSAQRIDRTTVNEFDLGRYLGKWHEIARFDTRFERDLVSVTAHYSLNPDGTIKVVNRGYNTRKEEWGESEAKATTTNQVGRLKVSFFPLVSSEYNILSIAEDYQWALVGSSSPDFLWILSRSKEINQATLDHILTLAEGRGYDTSKLLIF